MIFKSQQGQLLVPDDKPRNLLKGCKDLKFRGYFEVTELEAYRAILDIKLSGVTLSVYNTTEKAPEPKSLSLNLNYPQVQVDTTGKSLEKLSALLDEVVKVFPSVLPNTIELVELPIPSGTLPSHLPVKSVFTLNKEGKFELSLLEGKWISAFSDINTAYIRK